MLYWLLLAMTLFGGGALACPAGFRSVDGACFECEAGTFSATPDADACSPCPDGTYSPQRGASLCHTHPVCPIGWKVATSGDAVSAPTCSQCPPGTFGNMTNSAACFPCPDGYFQDTPGQMVCKTLSVCAAGEFTLRKGTRLADTECAACPPGFFSDSSAASACAACPAGKFRATPGAVSCMDFSVCLAGHFVFAAATPTTDTLCRLCPPGFYSPEQNSLACLPCPVGAFAAASGSQTCTAARGCGDRDVVVGPTPTSDRECESPSDAAASTVEAVFIGLALVFAIVLIGAVLNRLNEDSTSARRKTRVGIDESHV